MRRLCLLGLLLLVAACAPPEEAQPAPTALPGEVANATLTPTTPPVTATRTPLPVATTVTEQEAPAPPTPTAPPSVPGPSPSPSPAPETAGHTAEGAYYLGDPAAPVTIIDYSDFL